MEQLLDSWVLDMRARKLSPQTVKTYRTGVRQFIAWCVAAEREPCLDKATTNAFVVALIDAGAEASTVKTRQQAVRYFSAWIAEELEEPDLLLGVKPVRVPEKALEPLSDEQLTALFKACVGKSFLDRRDEALMRLMAEALPRAEDVLSMTISGTNVQQGTAALVGKGSRPRVVPFGPKTAVALSRYLRLRSKHRLADTDTFWLGDRGKTFGYNGLYKALRDRAEVAGISGFHPHRLRRTGATRWLREGGSETGLMAVAGWSSLAMVQRYTSYTKQTRAAEEARGLNLGDL